jgi:hypothetical protein
MLPRTSGGSSRTRTTSPGRPLMTSQALAPRLGEGSRRQEARLAHTTTSSESCSVGSRMASAPLRTLWQVFATTSSRSRTVSLSSTAASLRRTSRLPATHLSSRATTLSSRATTTSWRRRRQAATAAQWRRHRTTTMTTTTTTRTTLRHRRPARHRRRRRRRRRHRNLRQLQPRLRRRRPAGGSHRVPSTLAPRTPRGLAR